MSPTRRRGHLVTAHVQPRRREQAGELAGDGGEERAGGLDARVEHVVDERLHADGPAAIGRVTERRDGGEGGEAVPGQVDLGDDDDAPRRGPLDPAGDLGAGVRAAERRRARAEQRRDRQAVAAPGADVGQGGEGFDGDAPGLIVRQVQMQPVEAAPRRDVDQPVDVGGREELASEVDVEAPPVPCRRVMPGPDVAAPPLTGERGERSLQGER